MKSLPLLCRKRWVVFVIWMGIAGLSFISTAEAAYCLGKCWWPRWGIWVSCYTSCPVLPPSPIPPPSLIPQVNAGLDIGADVGQLITFNGFFLDTDNDAPYTYLWKFGDGHTTMGTLSKVGNISISHVYTQAGEFTATLEITDRSGKKGSHQITVKVVPINDDTCDPARITLRSKVPFGGSEAVVKQYR